LRRISRSLGQISRSLRRATRNSERANRSLRLVPRSLRRARRDSRHPTMRAEQATGALPCAFGGANRATGARSDDEGVQKCLPSPRPYRLPSLDHTAPRYSVVQSRPCQRRRKPPPTLARVQLCRSTRSPAYSWPICQMRADPLFRVRGTTSR